MSQKITVLATTVFAALAFSAVAASAASAANNTHHITAPEPWVPTVKALSAKQEFRATTANELPRYECEEVSASITEHVPETTDEITVIPEYEKCLAFKAGSEAIAYVEPEECDYTFTGTTTEGNPTGGIHASVDIANHVNPGEPCEIEIKVTVFKFKCASVPSQEVADAVRYVQDEDNIIIEATAHNITNTTTNSIACPTPSGKTEVHNDGSYTGEVTVEGSNTGGGGVPLELQTLVTEQ